MAAATTSQPVQQIGFCQAPDGVRIAYAVHGHGPALLISTCWLSHLQFDWQSPVWRHFLTDLGQFATVIRFDERGHGLSDWDVTDHGLEARVGDLEAVAEAAGHPTFALMGMAQGGPVAVAYAVRHPERVTRMLFYGSFSNATRLMTEEDRHVEDAFEPLIKAGWARPDSTFRRVFTSLMIPGATEQQMTWIDDLQRVATSASTAAIARQQRREADVDALLAHVRAPTLVLHSTGDQMNKFELGRALASGIAGARLVALPSNNHIVLADEPAWAIFVDEVRRFLEPDVRPSAPEPVRELLSDRELEVLHLVAQGQDNSRVADALHVSVRTVERHLQNIYAKLGLQGHSARVAAAARLLA
jgi:pimeloyl-ACP methyl ester carboxylesterase/DNA-binding CsgD family transcriptional regulator